MTNDNQSAAVHSAYSARAAEYIELLGTMSSVHPSDRQLVSTWADQEAGSVLDVGCGPGHWTDFLTLRGVDVRGIDLNPEFIAHASASFPASRFELGSMDALDAESGSVGGVLSWYSLIHHDPAHLATALTEFARVLRPGGGLLIGYFTGTRIESFDHAVVTAYRWPVEALSATLEQAGFEVVEAHTRTAPGHRPHGAIVARRAENG